MQNTDISSTQNQNHSYAIKSDNGSLTNVKISWQNIQEQAQKASNIWIAEIKSRRMWQSSKKGPEQSRTGNKNAGMNVTIKIDENPLSTWVCSVIYTAPREEIKMCDLVVYLLVDFKHRPMVGRTGLQLCSTVGWQGVL